MPRDKTESHERVVRAAKEEFLEKGFEKASMREIGAKAGMTPAGLYRHYKSKEDMFNALVEPAVAELERWYSEHVSNSYNLINSDADKSELFASTNIDFVRDILYKYNDEFQLLLKKAEGTKYANFIHELIYKEQRDFLEALRYMKSVGMNVKVPSEEEMHMLMSAYTTAMLEPFMHNMSREDAEKCLKTIGDFFMPGWQKMMGF